MTRTALLAATALALVATTPAFAQNPPADPNAPVGTADNDAPAPGQASTSTSSSGGAYDDIVVTAQRQNERLQDVPIAVSAFSTATLERQQIVNPSALQQTLPNITFTKTNFTGSSFTIRGVGDLCTGTSCDSATAIHVNDMPVLGSRLFETEFFDLERVEVLRGPQGTLFGRNATSGVVNFITAKADPSGFHLTADGEYGNYESIRLRGMVNVPIGETLAVRVAGIYLNRDGYTLNTFTGNRIDDRDQYAVRGTISWEPTTDTRIDLIGSYFREKDNRSRIQKQLCHRDPTGVLGCLPDYATFETPNGNSTLAAVLTSREFFAVNNAALAPFGLQSLYGPDTYTGVVNPRDVRTVRIDYEPTYFAEEQQYILKAFHDFGQVSVNLTGGYTKGAVSSRTDYNLAVENPYTNNPGLLALDAAGRPGGPAAFLNGVRQTLIPNGPAGGVCQSDIDPTSFGVYGGNSVGCFAQSLDFDQSNGKSEQWSAEGHIDTAFDGPFNFLLGGIYYDLTSNEGDYYVNAFGLDYASGILGAAQSATIPGVNGRAFLGPPFYRNALRNYHLKSYGIFGEAYAQISEALKLTIGLRYNHDDKAISSRNLTLNFLTPYAATDITQALNYTAVDFDAATAGIQEFAVNQVAFSRLTGRAVLDYKITPDNLIYASYSRGYKSGGINPPLPPTFNVPTTFSPEKVDSFEIGSKNTFAGGQLRLNATAFYYKYQGLQLSRIVARTSVNDNVNVNIYGLELESIVAPTPQLVINMNASYLHTKVSDDKLLVNPRDVSGGRPDAVIIKDITNASNCAVFSNTGSAALSNAYVGAVNSGIGLRAPVTLPGTNTTGAFGICSALASTAANPPTALRAAFGVPTGALPFTVTDGVGVNIAGNRLPQAPTYKFSVGAQYTIDFANGWSLIPRADLNYTGDSFGSIFNNPINRIQGYEVVNAQIQLNGAEDRWFLRAFVQNLTDNDATTGLYVTDQSSGLFTNIFTIDPRRYGIAAGVKF